MDPKQALSEIVNSCRQFQMAPAQWEDGWLPRFKAIADALNGTEPAELAAVED